MPPSVARAYGEPWRAVRGALVSDEVLKPTLRAAGERAYYGGNLIAESMRGPHVQRAADCVNFCAGVEFKPGMAYVGGLVDVLNALDQLHARMPEPQFPCTDREYYEMYSDIEQILQMFGRGASARERLELL